MTPAVTAAENWEKGYFIIISFLLPLRFEKKKILNQ
jgi:hypothetical protein